MNEVDQSIDGSRNEASADRPLVMCSQAGSAMSAAAETSSAPSLTRMNSAVVSFEDLKWPLLGMVTLIGIMLWVFNDFFSRQLEWAVRHQADWGHTLAIPFIAGYFVYLNRKKLLAQPFRTTWIGLVPIVLGVGWYILCSVGPQAIKHHNFNGLGVGMTLFGIVLLFCGWRAMMVLLFPLAYLFIFGQTISDRFMDIVTFKLQDIAARGSHVILILMGIDTERMGNVLTVYFDGEPRQLNIAEACSGMRMLMAFLALGVAMAYVMLKHLWQQIILVLMAFPTAIFVNMLRVVTLALLSMVDVNLAAGDFHTFIGLIWLVPAFLIYLGCMWVVTNIVVEEDGSDSDEAARNTGKQNNRGDS
jgi:exosortase